jgi:hypothetical protein
MKSTVLRLFVFMCIAAFVAIPVSAREIAASNPGQISAQQAIPVQILGKTIEIRKGMTRADAKSTFASLTREAPSVDSAERLQYDLILVPNNAPVSIMFDFDKKGVVTGFTLDANLKKQNPAAAKLVEWLQINAGKPQTKGKGNMTWVFAGWKIEHASGGSGEDSAYRVEMTMVK